jgi:AbrB family looped-hinge helix DNA binding protein
MASTISIDRAGRLVVPKSLRQRLGLVGGGKLRMWEEDGRLLMERVPDETVLVEDGGLLLCGGRLEGDFASIDDLRDERIDELVRDAIR